MAPHVLDHVRDTDGNVVDTFDPEVWTTAMDAGAAAIMRGAMLGVVTDGTASRLSIPGFEVGGKTGTARSEEHTSELQSLMRISYAVFCLKKKTNDTKI